jgi:hypothetical protein
MRAAVLRRPRLARRRSVAGSESRRSQDAGKSLSQTIRDGGAERSGKASRWSGSLALLVPPTQSARSAPDCGGSLEDELCTRAAKQEEKKKR